MKWETEFTIGAGHPSLPGHFPGNPIVPGVVILDEVVVALRAALPGLRVSGMVQVKFLAPLRPGETVQLALERTSDTHAQFQCRSSDTVIASGSLRLAPGEAQ